MMITDIYGLTRVLNDMKIPIRTEYEYWIRTVISHTPTHFVDLNSDLLTGVAAPSIHAWQAATWDRGGDKLKKMRVSRCGLIIVKLVTAPACIRSDPIRMVRYFRLQRAEMSGTEGFTWTSRTLEFCVVHRLPKGPSTYSFSELMCRRLIFDVIIIIEEVKRDENISYYPRPTFQEKNGYHDE